MKYRILRKGEVYKPGDEFGTFPPPPKSWVLVEDGIGKVHGSFYVKDTIVRRPLKKVEEKTVYCCYCLFPPCRFKIKDPSLKGWVWRCDSKKKCPARHDENYGVAANVKQQPQPKICPSCKGTGISKVKYSSSTNICWKCKGLGEFQAVR